jgi:hypothetical protein
MLRRLDILALACYSVFPGPALAQPAIGGCEVGTGLAPDLERAHADADSPVLALEDRVAGFRRLLAAHPTDPFVNRLYLATYGGYARQPLYDRQLLPHYEALYGENPDDPACAYLHAIAAQHRDPARSKAIFERLDRDFPESPWPLLSLSSDWSRDYVEGPLKSTASRATGSSMPYAFCAWSAKLASARVSCRMCWRRWARIAQP